VPDRHSLIRAWTAPARVGGRWVVRTVESLRRQAPGARMVGEMTVRYGSREAATRLGLRKKNEQK